MANELDAWVAKKTKNPERPPVQIRSAKGIYADEPEPKPLADYKAMRQATYYMEPQQVKALKLMAVHEERNISELVREAVAAYLESKGN